jgi:CheY-like chemotaxis protein
MKILVVDDNRFLASVLQMMLEDEGYAVKAVGDGRDGYLTYLSFKPDLVITDIQIPERNGMDLMEHIRTHNPAIGTIYMVKGIRKWFSQLLDKPMFRIIFIVVCFLTRNKSFHPFAYVTSGANLC